MQTRVAVMGIVVENTDSVERLNTLLHEYGSYIIGRMGIPYRARNINIVSIAIDAPQDVISALSGKIGNLDGISVKTAYPMCRAMNKAKQLIDRLEAQHSLSIEEYEYLIENQSDELAAYAAEKAVALRKQVYGTDVYIRGLIEIGNICRNDCYYCGIRRSNPACDRYRLTEAQILDCAREGYALGFRTFVMQGGEDGAFSVDVVCHLVRQIKAEFPDCAVTLSLGEFPREAYQAMFDAGADRYLLRHETANKAHYEKLHPAQMSFDNRMRCLRDLKDIGYQTGCGFMVGSPYQTARTLAEDLKFIEEFRPEMCGIGPFIPQKDTPFRDFPAGTCEQTVYLLSLLRLIQPHLLLPATTALGTIRPDGRERGLQAGANVVMPNLSPLGVRKKYALYDGKLCTGEEAAQCIGCLSRRVASVGCRIVTARGDIIR